MGDKYDFSVYYNPELYESLDQLASLFPVESVASERMHGSRKLAMWDGPFDEFIYIDINSVILDSVDFAFPLLDTADIVTASSGMKDKIWRDSVDKADVLSPEQINYGADTGFILSSKRFATTEQLLEKTIRDHAFLQENLVREVWDQGVLNYLFATSGMRSGVRYSSLNDIADQRMVSTKVLHERHGDYEIGDDGVVMTHDYRLDNTHDPEYRFFLLHWNGKTCDQDINFSSSCVIWEHWRNLSRLASSPKL